MADLHAPEPAANGTDAGAAAESADGPAAPAPPYSKRRRRPSVRLGDIGARTTAAADLSLQRHPKPPTSSHVRSPRLAHSDENAEPHRRAPRPPPRRARSAWLLAGGDGYEQEGEPYDEEAGEELSNSAAAAPATARVSRSLEANPEFAGDESDGVAEWGLPNGRFAVPVRCRVRTWLDGLGLGRYAPVFEIHEVDDEVLPLLTLEDLKEMGIGAVGSRRKMYAAIQKLRQNAVS